MDRRLIDYLPPFVQEYREVKAIMDAEQISTETAWADAENVLADQFVQEATEKGIARYEKILNIIPKGNYTLDERKFNVLAKMNEQLPYTEAQLKSSLAALCGEEGYFLKIDANDYTVTVKLVLANENNIESVKELLYKMLPANMKYTVMMFNTYSILNLYTHGQLNAFTHKEVREALI